MAKECSTAWGICRYDGTPLHHLNDNWRVCERCNRRWPAAVVEPCPLTADVIVDPGFNVPVVMCRWHAAAFIGATRGAAVLDAPVDFNPWEHAHVA